MYNGIGLQTPRGSGTNGYIQTNKFFVKPRPVRPEAKEFQNGQGAGGVTKKANPDILEHDRKRQIELQLTVFRDDLAERGCSEAEIEDRVEHLRLRLDAESLRQIAKGQDNNNKFSDTQTHQIAAKKEKKLEAFKDALHIGDIKEGEAFDRELQEQRKQERILAREERERERQEKELENQREEKRKEKEKKKVERAEQKEKERQEREKLKKEREEQRKKKIEENEKERKEQEHTNTKTEKRKHEDGKVGRSKDTHGKEVSLASHDDRERKQCSKRGRRYTKTNRRSRKSSRKYDRESESDSYSDSGTSRDSDTSSGSRSSSYTDTSRSSSTDDSESDSQSAGSINSDGVDKRKLEKGKRKTKHIDERNSKVFKHKEDELLKKQSKTDSAKHTDGRRAPELPTERGRRNYKENYQNDDKIVSHREYSGKHEESLKRRQGSDDDNNEDSHYNKREQGYTEVGNKKYEDGRRLESDHEHTGRLEESHKRKHNSHDDTGDDPFSKRRNLGHHDTGRRNNADVRRLESERGHAEKLEDSHNRKHNSHDDTEDDSFSKRRIPTQHDTWKRNNEDGRKLEREYAGKGEGEGEGEGEDSHKRKHIPSDDIDEDLYSKKRNMGRHEIGRRKNEDNERLEREHDRRHDDRCDSRKYEDRREREHDRRHDDRRYEDRHDYRKYDGRHDNKTKQESFRPKESPRKMDSREKEYYKDNYADRKY